MINNFRQKTKEILVALWGSFACTAEKLPKGIAWIFKDGLNLISWLDGTYDFTYSSSPQLLSDSSSLSGSWKPSIN